MTQDDQTENAGAPESQRSIALSRALAQLQNRWRPLVLDLGPARNTTLAVFSRQRCRLHVEDLPDGLDAPAPAGRPLLSLAADEFPDLVLAWDLFDYLEPAVRRRLGGEIVEHSRPGTLLFLLVHTRHRMPPRPATWRIADRGTRLLQAPSPGAERDAPELKEPDLRKLLPGYAVEASLLLRSGMQEYLLVFGEQGPAEPAATG